MLDWIRLKLKKWLASDDKPPLSNVPTDMMLRVLVDGECRRLFVTGAVGITLRVSDGTLTRLVIKEQCLDQEEFLRIWKHMSPGAKGWTWMSDGASADPSDVV